MCRNTRTGGNVKKILLVEDREDDILLARVVINRIRADVEISVARDGEEALTLLGGTPSGHFNLVLLDINLSGMDGFSVLRHIRAYKHLSGLSVCMLTTSPCAEDITEAENLSADLYLTKPLGIKDFEVIMQGVLDRFL
jgi:DNA-binding response OmpR family regulator